MLKLVPFKGGKIQTETSSLTTCLIGCFDERRSKQPIKWLENVLKYEVSV